MRTRRFDFADPRGVMFDFAIFGSARLVLNCSWTVSCAALDVGLPPFSWKSSCRLKNVPVALGQQN